MKPFKKILVPSDFSAHSQEALRAAADLSARYEATVTIVHAYEPVAYPLPEGYVVFTATQLADMQTQFEKQLATAKRDALDAGARQVETKQLMGNPAHEVVEYAKQHGFDVIVMGTHGRRGIKHALLGSVAERVLRIAPCPVLIVKAPA